VTLPISNKEVIDQCLGTILAGVTVRRRFTDQSWASIAFQAARCFSALGMVSVGTLLATGIVNSWILIGSLRGLVSTDYGQLVVVKIALFVALCHHQ